MLRLILSVLFPREQHVRSSCKWPAETPTSRRGSFWNLFQVRGVGRGVLRWPIMMMKAFTDFAGKIFQLLHHPGVVPGLGLK